MPLGNRAQRLASLISEMKEGTHEQKAIASAVGQCIDYDKTLAQAIELAACAREFVQNLKALDYNPTEST